MFVGVFLKFPIICGTKYLYCELNPFFFVNLPLRKSYSRVVYFYYLL